MKTIHLCVNSLLAKLSRMLKNCSNHKTFIAKAFAGTRFVESSPPFQEDISSGSCGKPTAEPRPRHRPGEYRSYQGRFYRRLTIFNSRSASREPLRRWTRSGRAKWQFRTCRVTRGEVAGRRSRRSLHFSIAYPATCDSVDHLVPIVSPFTLLDSERALSRPSSSTPDRTLAVFRAPPRSRDDPGRFRSAPGP